MARPMLPIVNNNNGTMSLCKNNHRVIQAKVIIRNVMYEPTKYSNRLNSTNCTAKDVAKLQ